MAKLTKSHHDVSDCQTIADVLDYVGGNFIAEEVPLITANGIDVPRHKAVIRPDNGTVLGVVGNRYVTIQNSTAFSLLDTIVQSYNGRYTHAWDVGGGQQTIIQAETDESVDIGGGDIVQGNITAINSHDGSSSLRIWFTPVRLVCLNALAASLRRKTHQFAIRHSATAESRAAEAAKIICQQSEYLEIFRDKARALKNKAIDAGIVEKFLSEVIGDPARGVDSDGTPKESARIRNQHDAITDLIKNGKGNSGESLWDAYNGVTEYIDHHKGSDAGDRGVSAIIGNGNAIKKRAWNVAQSLATA